MFGEIFLLFYRLLFFTAGNVPRNDMHRNALVTCILDKYFDAGVLKQTPFKAELSDAPGAIFYEKDSVPKYRLPCLT